MYERGRAPGSSKVSGVPRLRDRTAFAEIAAAITSAGSVALDIETFGARKARRVSTRGAARSACFR